MDIIKIILDRIWEDFNNYGDISLDLRAGSRHVVEELKNDNSDDVKDALKSFIELSQKFISGKYDFNDKDNYTYFKNTFKLIYNELFPETKI